MPWRCPACIVAIQHNELESEPRLGQVYRCHICRLELVFDASVGRLTVVMSREDEPNQRIRDTD